MGNQQPQKNQQAKVQIIKQTQMAIPVIPVEEAKFVQQIQHENVKNVQQRKSISSVLQQKSNQPSLVVQPRLSKKQPSKKQLPPLKLKNMRESLQGNNPNLPQQNVSNYDQLEELKCQKIGQVVQNTQKNRENDILEDQQSQGQKQNNDVAVHLRPKKFRPSQNTINLRKINYTTSTTAQVSDMQEMQGINVL